jgi:hypothetical protein
VWSIKALRGRRLAVEHAEHGKGKGAGEWMAVESNGRKIEAGK